MKNSSNSVHEDILFHIAARLSNEDLRKMVMTNLWIPLKKLLSENRFWYARSEYRVGQNLQERDADWKRIYYALHSDRYPNRRWKLALDYLPSMLVVTEVNSVLILDDDDRSYLWKNVKSPEVLDYLLHTYYLDSSEEYVLEGLSESVSEGRTQMIAPLLCLLDRYLEDEDHNGVRSQVSSFGEEAAANGHLEVLKILLSREDIFNIDSIAAILDAAVRIDQISIVEYLANKYAFSDSAYHMICVAAIVEEKVQSLLIILDKYAEYRSNSRSLFDLSIHRGATEIVRMFLNSGRAGVMSDDLDWNGILHGAVSRSQLEFIPYILLYTDPDLESLKIAAATGHAPLEILLEDARADPNEDIMSILLSTTEETARILAGDCRIRVEGMNVEVIRAFISALNKSIGNNIAGFILGESLADSLARENAGRVIERDGIYSLLLRYILIKRPSAHELLDWMIERRDEKIIQAASSIIEDYPETESQIVPIRALLLCMLYPTLSLQNLISHLRAEGASRQDVTRSARLVGAFLGRKMILARESE